MRCSCCGAVFTAPGESAVRLISGFGSLPPEKRALYDTRRMRRGRRNSFLLWAAIFASGAALSLFAAQGLAVSAFGVWPILFFKDVRLDAEKAFARYKK